MNNKAIGAKGLEAASLGLVPGYDGEKEFSNKQKDKNASSETPVTKRDSLFSREKKINILKISTGGFKDGILQHNMPCPVCLENLATYENVGGRGCFAPCMKCSAEGYVIKKKWF